MCDPSLCPITVSFDAAEKVIANHAGIHEDPTASLGMIAINRACAAQVQESYPCPGAGLDSHHNMHCPLGSIIGDVFSMTMYRMQPAVMISPEKVISAETDRSTGAFL
jgi:hypothetical protein